MCTITIDRTGKCANIGYKQRRDTVEKTVIALFIALHINNWFSEPILIYAGNESKSVPARSLKNRYMNIDSCNYCVTYVFSSSNVFRTPSI